MTDKLRVLESLARSTGNSVIQWAADEIARLTFGRDAAIRERDEARAECERLRACVAELEFAYSAECDARAQAHRELSDLAAAVRERESGEECDHSYAAQCREAAAARDRADRMIPAPPPRGWLTAEERKAVDAARDYFDDDNHGDSECVFIARMLKQLLARSTPPRVKVPSKLVLCEGSGVRIVYDAGKVKRAIREAGGEVE